MITGVYLVLDPGAIRGRASVTVADEAIRGGVSAVQWRQKVGSWSSAWKEIEAVRDLCREAGVPFLVNDRVDVALAVEADGAHVGQDDLPADAARRLLEGRILGVSITEAGQVEAAVRAGADYLGVGPIFPTGSKADAAPAGGYDLVREVRERTTLPIVAIGGIGIETVPSVRAAGAEAVAVISAIGSAPDVEAATRTLVRAMKGVAV